MTKITNDLLKEAIADANRIRETAIATAKLQLEESIAPTIKKEITKALSQDEAHDPTVGSKAGDFGKVAEIANDASSEIGKGDNKEPSKATSDSSGVGSSGESGNGEGETPKKMDGEDKEYTKKKDLDENLDEEINEELDLETIIKELQREVDALTRLEAGDYDAQFGGNDEDELDLDGDGDVDTGGDNGDSEVPAVDVGTDNGNGDDDSVADVPTDLDGGGEDDEDEENFDLEAILREIEAELSEEGNDQVAEQNAKLKEELAQYRKAVGILRTKLNEVNLLNAKLLYTNKLFKNKELSQDQKVHIIETFDLATTLREVKLLYATLCESTFTVPGKKKVKNSSTEVVTESIASSVVQSSTKPEKSQVIEEDSYAGLRKRMQKLAGVKVL